MPKRLSIEEVKALVRQGILLSPEAAQVLIDEIDRLKKNADDEASQFNDGCEAAERGESDDNEPSYEHNTDQWRVGWAWGRYNKERKANNGNLYHPTDERWVRT
jgi:hypothetical protein